MFRRSDGLIVVSLDPPLLGISPTLDDLLQNFDEEISFLMDDDVLALEALIPSELLCDGERNARLENSVRLSYNLARLINNWEGFRDLACL